MNAVAKPLTITCTACGGEGRKIRSRYGGNDPDTWDAGPCERCEETGYELLCCDLCGNYGATEFFGGRPFHAECAEEARADAFWVGEDAL